MERLAGGPVHDEYFSTNVPGLVRYIKSKIKKKFDFEEACKALSQAGNKWTDIKRTLIGMKNSAQKGYLLERKFDYRVPNPVVGSNDIPGHSHISKDKLKK